MSLIGIYRPGSIYSEYAISTYTIKKQNIKKIVLTLQRTDIIGSIYIKICSRHITKTPLFCDTRYISSSPAEMNLPKSADILLELSGPRLVNPLPGNGIYRVANALKAELYDPNNTLIDTQYIDAYLATPSLDIIAQGTNYYDRINYVLYILYDEAIAVTEKFCVYNYIALGAYLVARTSTKISLASYDSNPLENYIDPRETIIGRGIACIKPSRYILATTYTEDIAAEYEWTDHRIRSYSFVCKTPSSYTSTL